MPTLRKDLRSDLDTAIKAARRVGEAGAREALAALAVGDAKPHDHLSKEDRALRNALRARGRTAGDEQHAKTGVQGVEHLVQIVAYENWHRMLFARFLAENHCLIEPEYQVPVSLDELDELARDEGTDRWTLAGRYASRMLPDIFRPDDAALTVMLPPETRQELQKLLADLPTEVFTASDSLGWTYQFWQAEKKKAVNESEVRIGADELPAVTQLFTEDYMVEFLLDNTLGAWWAGKNLAKIAGKHSEMAAREAVALPGCSWTYLRFVQGENGNWTPEAGIFERWPNSAKDLTCLDPCMGSGHFVVAMLERLVALRMAEEGLPEKATVAAVIRDNLFGLEIDPRCTQIAAFNLALASWRRVGYCPLPAMNLACSGLSPNASEADWLALAGGDEKIQRGMERLYRLFKNAPVLGSLIDPRASTSDLFVAEFDELQPLLEKALAQELQDEAAREMAVTARGLAKAGEILAEQFTLVATNVPYLGRGKQESVLKDYCEKNYPNAKADLATCFIQRCLDLTASNASAALVTPISWLFQPNYTALREASLSDVSFLFSIRLGSHAFETITGEVVKAALVGLTKSLPTRRHVFATADTTRTPTAVLKAEAIRDGQLELIVQSTQLDNPDAIVGQDLSGSPALLSDRCHSFQGLCTSDDAQFKYTFWEIKRMSSDWRWIQSSAQSAGEVGGCSSILFWEEGEGRYFRHAQALKAEGRLGGWKSGGKAWGKRGIAINVTKNLHVNYYLGEFYDNTIAALVTLNEDDLPAIYEFTTSTDYKNALRELDPSLSVTEHTLLKVPFDLEHWKRVAAKKYPHGLPKPHASDPRQWLFNGHPKDSNQPLHVSLARLLGYQWPRQTGSSFPDCPALGKDGLEEFADEDGVVCLSPLRGERSAADRLRTLLSAALGDHDEHSLIDNSGGRTRNLEDWLRGEAFEQHCKLFHNFPFIWHIWDGRPDGFHALINYHKLAAGDGDGRKLLETLIYSYLGDWIRQQQDDASREVPGAEGRVIAAQTLEGELKAILAGESPYDLFVRWKPLHEQAIGWEPDINDGVRLNIRPFLLARDVARKGAGILKFKPNIKWTKDRGKEPVRAKDDFPWFWSWDEAEQDFMGGDEFDGNRWNDCHYSRATKQAARERKSAGGI